MAQLAVVAEPEKRQRPLFTLDQSFHDRFDLVAKVALAAAGGNPDRARNVSKGRWDKQCAMSGTDLPKAETIRQWARTGGSWDRALEVALAPAAKRLQILNRLQTSIAATGSEDTGKVVVSDDERALRCVRQRLKHSPSVAEYEKTANEMNAARRQKHSIVASVLPSSKAIMERRGSWAAALAFAKLAPRPTVSASTSAPDPVATLDQFIDEQGFLPVEVYFRAWASHKGIKLPGAERRKSFSMYVKEVRRRRSARKVATPRKAKPLDECDPLTKPEPRAPYTHADRISHLQRFAKKHLAPGQRPRSKDYQAVAPSDGLMGLRHLTKEHDWQDLCRMAGIA